MITNVNTSSEVLKNGVLNAHRVIRDMIYTNINTIKVSEQMSNDFVCLLLFDATIVKELNYSYLDDIEISKFGDITIICEDKQRFLESLDFLEKYLDYNLHNVKHLAQA